MADAVDLKANRRSDKGKQVAKQLRREGQLPAVVYGENEDAIPLIVDLKELEKILSIQGRNAIVSLVTGESKNSTTNTIMKEIQHHPVQGHIMHVDFHRIDLTQKIIVEVAVVAEGIPAGVRNDGGILEHMLHHLEVECLPTEIPEQILVNVDSLNIGDSIHVEDLSIEGDTRIVTEEDRSVFVVVPPTLKQEDEEEEEGVEEMDLDEEMQEPELIERGKRDEEEEEDGS